MVSSRSPNVQVKALLELKDVANAKLESGDAEEAAEQYTVALLRLKEVAEEVQAAESLTLKAVLLANRAQSHLKLEHWDRALADCEECLKIQPDNAKALHRQSLAKQGLEDHERRRSQGEALKQALFCKNAGNKLLTDRQFEAAIRKYSEGLDWLEDLDIGNDARIALLANRCQARLKRGLWSEALQDAEAILLEEPTHPKARYRRAKALLELGRRQEAADVLEQLDASNEDVAELLRLVNQPAAASRRTEPEAPELMELVRGRQVVQRRVEEDAEAKRLLKEAEAAMHRKDFRQALKFADGACVELERLRAEDRRDKARQLAQQLLTVHVLQVRCHLALKDFAVAGELAQRALKLHRYEEERLERDFSMVAALRTSAPVVEMMQTIAEAVDALSSDLETVQAKLRRLEKADFVAPLRASLLVRKATLSGDGEADLRRALVLDPSCQTAQDLLKSKIRVVNTFLHVVDDIPNVQSSFSEPAPVVLPSDDLPMMPWNTYDSFEVDPLDEPFMAKVSTLEYFETVSAFCREDPWALTPRAMEEPSDLSEPSEAFACRVSTFDLFEEETFKPIEALPISIPAKVNPMAVANLPLCKVADGDVAHVVSEPMQKLATFDFFEDRNGAWPAGYPFPNLAGLAAVKADVSNASTASTTPSTPSAKSCALPLHVGSENGKEVIHWNVDGRKLESQDKQILSPEFELQLPGAGATPFRLMILAKETRGKGCRGFLKAKGRGRLFIKCGSSSVPPTAAAVRFRITLGPGTDAEKSKVLQPHQFADHCSCPFQEEKDDWGLLPMVSDSKHFEVVVEVLADN